MMHGQVLQTESRPLTLGTFGAGAEVLTRRERASEGPPPTRASDREINLNRERLVLLVDDHCLLLLRLAFGGSTRESVTRRSREN